MLLLGTRFPSAQPGATTIQIAANQPGGAIPSTLFGLFFEDINFAADGGVSAERVKNQSFEFPDPLMGWRRATIEGARGTFAAATDRPASTHNPHYLRVTSEAGAYGVSNDGFRGIGIEKDAKYTVTVLARRVGDGPGSIRAELETGRNAGSGAVSLNGLTNEWRTYKGTIVAETTDPRATLRILVDGPATVDFDMVSLVPEETWQRREHGFRRDLVKLLADIHPGFLRFPGGCIVEGRFLAGRYQWKTTIGDPSERTVIINRWNDEFPHRATPDYY
jgi:alpha-L-arabinofuranosidase